MHVPLLTWFVPLTYASGKNRNETQACCINCCSTAIPALHMLQCSRQTRFSLELKHHFKVFTSVVPSWKYKMYRTVRSMVAEYFQLPETLSRMTGLALRHCHWWTALTKRPVHRESWEESPGCSPEAHTSTHQSPQYRQLRITPINDC